MELSEETSWQGKVVFVTGAASGIGKAQCKTFLSVGATVFGVDVAEMEQCLTKHANFYFAQADVGNKFEVDQAVARCLEKTKQIDVLINTAGILDAYKPTLETDEQLWDQVMRVNVKGTYLVTNAVLPSMLKRKKGKIVNMASIAGLITGGGGAAYTASKHAIIGYTKQLVHDYAALGIRANALAPGAIKTPMNAADFSGSGEMAQWVANETPARRWANPEEVAKLTLFIASEAADYIHGAVIPIDGGWLCK
ncbi:3-oxoacyl-ACP reductase [Vagococcus entomophilus]|uniref:3-oxoacyl-ACP reductase n=1 Tax=Vagococcus entomophilus TaxID=1160095 RepID=A0A430AEV1_9ENTE|nr:3-oxoacyl-ACP reductase [Vagococcus entomophilus]RSU05966.1 3-oxoacyl-ACP reductase [Vagococcus entomophilus]